MGESRDVQRALVGKPEGKGHLEDPGIDGRKYLAGSSVSGMWIDLDQDSERWRALVIAVMNLWVP